MSEKVYELYGSRTEAPEDIDDTSQTAPRRAGDIVDHLCEQLGNDIISGALQPGQKLSEPELARRFGISRGPVREAIRRLEERKFVMRKPNSGARVSLISAQDIVDLYYLREALEGMAARLAAERITKDEIAEAYRILEFQRAAWEKEGPTGPGYLDGNLDFHVLIRKASRNEVLSQQLFDHWHFLSRPWLRQNPGFTMRGNAAIDDHYRILHALETRDCELAEILMRRHVSSNRRRYEKVLEAERQERENS